MVGIWCGPFCYCITMFSRKSWESCQQSFLKTSKKCNNTFNDHKLRSFLFATGESMYSEDNDIMLKSLHIPIRGNMGLLFCMCPQAVSRLCLCIVWDLQSPRTTWPSGWHVHWRTRVQDLGCVSFYEPVEPIKPFIGHCTKWTPSRWLVSGV